MKVRINNCPVEYQLENEKNVTEIISSITRWATERNLVFIEAQIDDTSYTPDTIPPLPVDKVDLINCMIHSKGDIVLTSLGEAMGYCDRVAMFIAKVSEGGGGDPAQASSLALGLDWISEVLKKILTMLGVTASEVRYRDGNLEGFIIRLDRLRERLKEDPSGEDFIAMLGGESGLFESMKDIFRMIMLSENLKSLIIQSIDSPNVLLNSLMEIREELPAQLLNLEDAAIAFQTGKDNQGSEKLQQFIDFIYRYIRTSSQISPVFDIDPAGISSGGTTLEDKNRLIRELLDQIVVVMENNDIISLADILEYEMRPALENIVLYIDLLLGKIGE